MAAMDCREYHSAKCSANTSAIANTEVTVAQIIKQVTSAYL